MMYYKQVEPSQGRRNSSTKKCKELESEILPIEEDFTPSPFWFLVEQPLAFLLRATDLWLFLCQDPPLNNASTQMAWKYF